MTFSGSQDAHLADLTEAQREAVLHGEGPLLILAAAGSGKTRVITRRVAHLICEGVRPSQILAITFTNKAANEMKQRVAALLPGIRVWMSTFHSLGVRLLRQYADQLGIDPNFTIYDQTDRTRMVRQSLDAAEIDNVRFTPETISAAISKAKNQLLRPAAYVHTANDFFKQTVARVYGVYEKKMRDANALDFDDLLLWPAIALKENEELRAELDARFRFVLIDEYQDTNKAQYAIARHLSVDQPNLCVVGDPDQSIYKWRGSDIRNILDFERDFPTARVINLEQNYRSTKAILRAASHLIRFNKQRKDKELRTENPEGQPVTMLSYETAIDEAEGIAERIREAVKSGKRNYRDFALLLRVNALTRNLETAFVKSRIPFQIVRGLAFFERKENRDVLAYLRVLVNPRDDLSFLRVVNEPTRGIGKVSLEHLRKYAEPREMNLLSAAAEVDKIPAIRGKASTGLKGFVLMMHDLRQQMDLPPDELISLVLDKTGYRRMLQNSSDPDDEERLANIEELITAAHQFVEEDESRTLADFLENITLASDVDGWDENQDCVSIMTLHAAKGLEFPVIHILAMEQGLLPHERSLANTEDVEEERRLAFVGMTRAKEELYLSHCKLREFRGQTLYAVPSMFFDEMPSDIDIVDLTAKPFAPSRAMQSWRSGGSPAADQGWRDAGVTSAEDWFSRPRGKGNSSTAAVDYIEGMIVDHDKYGRGLITAVSGYGAMRKIKIRFQTAGERTFVANKAKLTVVEPN